MIANDNSRIPERVLRIIKETICTSEDINNVAHALMLRDGLAVLCEARGLEPGQVVKASSIERSYGNRLFSGMRRPSRDTVLQLAFGLGLSADEAQQLLKIAHVLHLVKEGQKVWKSQIIE